MSSPPPTGDEKHLRVAASPNSSAETPTTISEQSSIKLADEKQPRQEDGAVEDGVVEDGAVEEGPRGGNDSDAPQAALPISQLIFVIVALVLGIFMVCVLLPRCGFWQPIHNLS